MSIYMNMSIERLSARLKGFAEEGESAEQGKERGLSLGA